MAFLYKRFRGAGRKRVLASPYWHIEHRDPASVTLSASGRVIPARGATPYRIDDPLQTARAKQLEAEMTLKERSAHSPRDQAQWKFWVVPFIESIVAGKSRARYLDAWRMLELWLDEMKIVFPAQMNYPIACTYIPWREKPDPANRKFQVLRSTANYEFKLFRRLMREAVRQSFCAGNAAREVELKSRKDQLRRLKPSLDDELLQEIWRAFDAEPERRRTCFRRAFAIALLHGVRLNETNVNPQTDLHLDDDIPAIKFSQKGSRIRWKPLHPQLIPFFKRLRESGATQTFPLDRDADGELRWNTAWFNFFTHAPRGGPLRRLTKNKSAAQQPFKKRPELEHIGFHCLRVTVNNVLRVAEIAKEVREMYLTHEHETAADTNAEYDHVKLREMLACHEPLARKWLKLD